MKFLEDADIGRIEKSLDHSTRARKLVLIKSLCWRREVRPCRASSRPEVACADSRSAPCLVLGLASREGAMRLAVALVSTLALFLLSACSDSSDSDFSSSTERGIDADINAAHDAGAPTIRNLGIYDGPQMYGGH